MAWASPFRLTLFSPANTWQIIIFTPESFVPSPPAMPADSVSVVHGGNRTGYVRAVTDVAYIRPRNGRGIVYEVISVSVVLVSVAVGIRAGIEFLFVVYPYIACQVGMRIHHSVVQYGNDNGRVARAFLPCFVAADIASGY